MPGPTLLEDGTYTLTDESGNSLGVAFRIQVLDTTRFGTFLLSSGHALKELYIADSTVMLKRWDSEAAGTAKILYCQWEDSRYDFSLLYTQSWLGVGLKCGSSPSRANAIVRGSPAGAGTAQTNLRAWVGGTETKDGLQLVDIVLRDVVAIDIPEATRGNANSYHMALRGLSGGPVVSGADEVFAVVSARNTRGLANRIYASPITEIAKELEEVGYTIRIATTNTQRFQIAESAIAGRLIARSLKTPEDGLILWEELSSLFYGGVPVDETLGVVLNNPQVHGISSLLERERGNFLLARFALKRGQFRRAQRILSSASHNLSSDTSPEFRTLRSLVDLRMLVEALPPSGHEARLDRITRSLGAVESSSELSDRMRAYEVSSAAGREALSISTLLAVGSQQVLGHFTRFRDMHHQITEEYGPVLYDKQGAVEIALTLLSLLWETEEISDMERIDQLSETVVMGHSGAAARKNLNMEFPVLMSEAVVFQRTQRLSEMFAALLISAEGLRRADLTLSHEGVTHVFAYLASQQTELAETISIFFKHGLTYGPNIYESTFNERLQDNEPLRNALAMISEYLAPETSAEELVALPISELF